MPPKKASVAAVKSELRCILQFGQENNVIEWREAMYNIATGLYGTTGMFFHLNRPYRFPPIQLRDYHPNSLDQPAAAEGAAADGEDDGNGNETDGSDAKTVQGENEPEAVAEEFTEQFINKLREGLEQQQSNNRWLTSAKSGRPRGILCRRHHRARSGKIHG